MTLVMTSVKKLTKTAVQDIFTSKQNGSYYKNYMTRNTTIAMLFSGDNYPLKLI